jgi:SAM-dependent methyltransferase
MAHEIYSGGYGQHLVSQFARRSLDREGAFFRPFLQPGMNVLDAGCGPGSMTVEIARIVAPGKVIGIDIGDEQFEVGRKLAGEMSNVEFRQANLYALEFAAETFDAVFLHAVLYHLNQPAQALREVFRVCKTGAVVGARDVDYGGDVRFPTSPLLDGAWDLITRVFAHNGGNIYFGRTQKRAFREAGFQVVEASATYDSFGTPEEVGSYAAYWIEFLGEMNRALVLQWCSEAELEQILDALRSWGAGEDSFYARARCQCVVRK